MDQLNLGLALIAGLTLVLSMGTRILRGHGFLPTEPIVAVAFGVVIGPAGFDLLRLSALGEPHFVVEEAARLTVALAVASIALRLPPDYFLRRARSMAALLGPGMVAMWLTSASVAYLALDIPFPMAVLVGAVVTPTDPVLANSIVVGETATRNIPKRLRYLLSSEAGANDGGAFPFVLLSILLLSQSVDGALTEWVTGAFPRVVAGAIGVGFLAGAIIGRVERWLSAKEYLEETSVFTITVTRTFAVLGIANLLATSGILAVFVAGISYNWQADPYDEAEQQRVEEVFNRLFTVPVFVFFGMVLPWAEWAALGWRSLALVAGILAFRRLPMLLALGRFIRPLDRPAATLFVGWFGPIGIAAVFYALLAVRETGAEIVWTAGSLVVAGSILGHGATATVLTHRYGELRDDAEWW